MLKIVLLVTDKWSCPAFHWRLFVRFGSSFCLAIAFVSHCFDLFGSCYLFAFAELSKFSAHECRNYYMLVRWGRGPAVPHRTSPTILTSNVFNDMASSQCRCADKKNGVRTNWTVNVLGWALQIVATMLQCCRCRRRTLPMGKDYSFVRNSWVRDEAEAELVSKFIYNLKCVRSVPFKTLLIFHSINIFL